MTDVRSQCRAVPQESRGHQDEASRRSRSRHRPIVAVAALCAVAMLVATPVGALVGSHGRQGGLAPRAVAPLVGFGKWTALGLTTLTTTPAVYEGPDLRAWVLWPTEPKVSEFTYEAAAIAPSGVVAAKPASIFGPAYWSSLSQPTLVKGGAGPLAIFDGGRSSSASDPYSHGCVVGDQEAGSTWTLQPWSLSANCVNPVPGAGEGPGGVVAAAWPGGWSGGHGVLYRVGVSSSIPASGVDSQIPLASGADASLTAVTSDTAGNGHFYVAYLQVFSNASDGYYVKDVTANGAVAKAPGSGTMSVNISPFAVPAMTSTNTHPGVFVVYCSNTSTCAVRLWRVGSAATRTVRGSLGANDTAVSPGPDGRLWIAWYNESKNTTSILRTNKADTAFGPVTTYPAPCFEHGLLGLSGGAFGRLTVALECINKADKLEMLFTQSVVPLAVTASAHVLPNTATHSVVYRVTDVGDPVSGATVIVHGRSAKTNAAGAATLTFPKLSAVGTFPVIAVAPNYTSARTVLTFVK
jgi:hypothetical protein